MGTFLIIVLVIAGIIVLLLLLAAFTKKSYSVFREIIIARPPAEVFNYIRYLRNQDYFNKWAMTDPHMRKEYKGTDGSVGFIYAWNGNKHAGEGEQEIMGITENERLDVEVRFKRPFKAIAKTPFALESIPGNQTKLTWGSASSMNYPMNVMLLFLDMDKLLGKDLETSLGNLKKILEK